eukprot:355137-Chlamydomonas_euryale.AAC.2
MVPPQHYRGCGQRKWHGRPRHAARLGVRHGARLGVRHGARQAARRDARRSARLGAGHGARTWCKICCKNGARRGTPAHASPAYQQTQNTTPPGPTSRYADQPAF